MTLIFEISFSWLLHASFILVGAVSFYDTENLQNNLISFFLIFSLENPKTSIEFLPN